MHTLPSVIGTTIKINKVIDIPPEPLQIPHFQSGEMIDIPIPSSHLGPGSVSARLMSHHRREGMIGEKSKMHSAKSMATGLIFHCHGGGFVAQSSKSHELYLRDWAVALDIPILSIDYSLAPEAPFPRAVEEVFYAYCWALKNCRLLGTTAETIVLAGDSAGANLNLACAIKCIDKQIRIPDGIFLAYCPVRISFDPSPARLLCLMDPLLPFGFMMRCLKAYACPSQLVLEKNKKLVAKKDAIKNAKSQNNNIAHVKEAAAASSTLSASSTGNNLKCSESESDMPTFVNVNENQCEKTDNSGSLDGSSLWEHIENDFALQEHKSPGSDGTSDTFASASLHSQTTVGNTDMMTPDESNGISFEEDSQPITIHKPSAYDGGGSVTYAASDSALTELEKVNELRSVSAANAIEISADAQQMGVANDSTKYVDDFVQRYILDTDNGPDNAILRSVPGTRSEENILLDHGRDMISVQNIQNKICQVVGNVTSSVSNTISSMTTSTPIRECTEFANVRNRLDSLIPKSPTEEFVFDIPRDPLLSPFWAVDEVLSKLPPTHILVRKKNNFFFIIFY